MDSAFRARPFPGNTAAELRAAIAAGRGTPAMVAELERRAAVAAGDMTRATPGERLRAARAEARQ